MPSPAPPPLTQSSAANSFETNGFHPAVEQWFEQNLGQPTAAQKAAWPAIANGQSTLVAAPTGSGKTLAAFLSAINSLVCESLERGLPTQTRVLYVSPLKALSADVHKNLQLPLAGIDQVLNAMDLPAAAITAMTRSGDTPQKDRNKMRRTPPHILVTTPESLYILLTSASGREMLSTVREVIVDELHAVADSKRGAHLTLSLERLAALTDATTGRRPLRIGLSATQKPIETMAAYLVGHNENGEIEPCHIVDTGHQRERDLRLCVPRSPLSAVMAAEVWGEIYGQLVELINTHSTTLIFVNNRRLAERIARFLGEALGDEAVTAHHGSLSKEHRLDAEMRLKNGELQALVATASLELGIDIGDIDLVVQLGSPRSIAALLQRVGRAGHQVGGTPKGRLFPLTRDELVECTALLDSVQRGELDAVRFFEQPLDVLAQQIVAEIAHQEWDEQALFEQYRRAWPYRDLSRESFTATVEMLSSSYAGRRGRREAQLHRDTVNGKLRGRKGSALRAVLNGGTIPDQFDYEVILQPEGTFIGTLNEEFAFESLPGDVFQLGNTPYRILQVAAGKVYVADAPGAMPSLPFWFGDAPGRSDELSYSVSRLRATVEEKLTTTSQPATTEWLLSELPLPESAAGQLVEYLATAKAALGVLPTQDQIVFERFFDGSGDLHFIVHSPFGSRVNRAWGLALRKRFCRKFNFELQAAALDDSIVLSLGSTHSFPINEPAKYLNAETCRDVLVQAVLDSPMFETRWRWNASIALAIVRRRGGKKQPPQFQRNDAEDLVAVVFPDQIACAENLPGKREVPDHPLVTQTLADCLTDSMDIAGLEHLLRRLESGDLQLHCAELTAPSPLSQEVVTAKPYAFLDDGEAENRRTLAIQYREPDTPESAAELSRLLPEAIEQVKQQAWPSANTADELHEAVVLLGVMTDVEMTTGSTDKDGLGIGWNHLRDELLAQRRIGRLTLGDEIRWVAVERLADIQAAYPDAECELPLETGGQREPALIELVRSRLEAAGPIAVITLATLLCLSEAEVSVALLALEQEGFAMRGQFGELNGEQWCERRLLARIHRYSLKSRRASVAAVSLSAFMRFLLNWQGITDKGEGVETLARRLEQLDGWSAPAQSWEAELLPSRVNHYSGMLLDQLGAGGQLSWARFHGRHGGVDHNSEEKKRRSGPIKATPISLCSRESLPGWRALWPLADSGNIQLSSAAEKLLEPLNSGPQFYGELVKASRLLPTQAEDALGELVAWGLVSADGFAGLRALVKPATKGRELSGHSRRRRGSAGTARGPRINYGGMEAGGRWWLMPNEFSDRDEALQQLVWTLLNRYGMVCRAIVNREHNHSQPLPPWRDLLYVLRRLEARGEIRGGRFVQHLSGEQFALPEAAAGLRQHATLSEHAEPQYALVAATDPANLLSILNDKASLSRTAGNRVLYRDGVPVATLEGAEVNWLIELDAQTETQAQSAIQGHRSIAGGYRSRTLH